MASKDIVLCLQKLRDSQAAEDCTDLLEQITKFSPCSNSETVQIMEGLTIVWERYEDLNTSSCNWRLLMFSAARKQLLCSKAYEEVFFSQISLASKMLEWCGKAFLLLEEQKIDFQLEARTFEIQKVLPEAFILANAVYAHLEECSFFTDKTSVCTVETYICQSLKFLNVTCLHGQIFKLHDFQRSAQELLGMALKVLLKFRAKFISAREEKILEHVESNPSEYARVVGYGVTMFMGLGKFAAANGRNWVGMLNIAWKGVTALLQINSGREVLTTMIDISNIITVTISCTIESMRNAADSWESLIDKRDDVSKVVDMKRLCIPAKFFLINAIRIASNYPHQAVNAFKDIATCALKVMALRFALSKHALLKVAAEAIVETLEPSLFLFLRTLLSSSELELDVKLQFLEHLIENDNGIEYSSMDEDACRDSGGRGVMDAIFSGQKETLKLGRLFIFLELLQSSRDCGKDIGFELARRLDLLFEMISDATIYAEIFQVQVFATYQLESSCKAIWQCLYIRILMALQVFTLSIAPTEAWVEVEEFLFRNTVHPHVLCRELILELWCFVARHSGVDLIQNHVCGLFSILSDMTNSPDATALEWPIRTIARLSCSLMKAAPDALAIQVYQTAFSKDPFVSQATAAVASALFKEHFPTHTLPEDIRTSLTSVVIHALSEFRNQITMTFKDVKEHIPKLLLVQDEVLCCFLELLIQETCEQGVQEEDTAGLIETTIALLKVFPTQPRRIQRAYYASSLSQSLKIISQLWRKMQPSEINSVVVALHNLFKSELCDDDLKDIKPVLAETLAGLSEISIPEVETNPVSNAVWELYHLILRERHWALAHLALTSFGYFASRTSCKELWRFVPPDATLAYDSGTGTQTDEDSFMASLRCFLEKEAAHPALMINNDELKALEHEGELQHKALHLLAHTQTKLDDSEPQELMEQEHMDLDADLHVDVADSQLPLEIDQAMKMLQEGLSLLKEKVPLWLRESGHNLEQEQQMGDQLSLLADMVAQMDAILTV